VFAVNVMATTDNAMRVWLSPDHIVDRVARPAAGHAVHAGRIVVATARDIIGVDAASGNAAWRATLAASTALYGSALRPLLYGDFVYVVASATHIVCLDAATGQELFVALPPVPMCPNLPTTAPVAVNGRVVVANCDNTFSVFDATPTVPRAPVALVNLSVTGGSAFMSLTSVDELGVALVWISPNEETNSGSNVVAAIDVATATVAWANAHATNPSAVVNGRVVLTNLTAAGLAAGPIIVDVSTGIVQSAVFGEFFGGNPVLLTASCAITTYTPPYPQVGGYASSKVPAAPPAPTVPRVAPPLRPAPAGVSVPPATPAPTVRAGVRWPTLGCVTAANAALPRLQACLDSLVAVVALAGEAAHSLDCDAAADTLRGCRAAYAAATCPAGVSSAAAAIWRLNGPWQPLELCKVIGLHQTGGAKRCRSAAGQQAFCAALWTPVEDVSAWRTLGVGFHSLQGFGPRAHTAAPLTTAAPPTTAAPAGKQRTTAPAGGAHVPSATKRPEGGGSTVTIIVCVAAVMALAVAALVGVVVMRTRHRGVRSYAGAAAAADGADDPSQRMMSAREANASFDTNTSVAASGYGGYGGVQHA
jgi:hypothetical protein